MLVTQNTVNAIIELIGECFRLNRILDRCVSVLGAKFAFNQSAELIHKGLAHYFPKLSDKIGESTLEYYNIPVEYLATPEGKKDYSSATEIIKEIEKEIVGFQSMMMGCAKIAFENNDIHVYSELLGMLQEVNKVTAQAILLSDKIDIYGDSPAYDHDVLDFWILGEDK